MLMAILKSHTSIIQTKDKKEIDTQGTDTQGIDTKEKEENCMKNIKNIEIKQPLPNGCDATLETIQIRDGKYSSEGAAREWSTVVSIFITLPSFKPISLSLSRSLYLSRFPLSKTTQIS